MTECGVESEVSSLGELALANILQTWDLGPALQFLPSELVMRQPWPRHRQNIANYIAQLGCCGGEPCSGHSHLNLVFQTRCLSFPVIHRILYLGWSYYCNDNQLISWPTEWLIAMTTFTLKMFKGEKGVKHIRSGRHFTTKASCPLPHHKHHNA